MPWLVSSLTVFSTSRNVRKSTSITVTKLIARNWVCTQLNNLPKQGLYVPQYHQDHMETPEEIDIHWFPTYFVHTSKQGKYVGSYSLTSIWMFHSDQLQTFFLNAAVFRLKSKVKSVYFWLVALKWECYENKKQVHLFCNQRKY